MQQSIRYTVRISSPITHYAEVEARIPTHGAERLVMFLPVWTPGSYLIREYSRHVEGLDARKIAKNRWVLETGGAAEAILRYRVYCHDLSVRGNFIDDRFALLQGAATFLTTEACLDAPHEIALELPREWAISACGLAGEGHRYLAPDYETLVDSPLLAGNPEVHEFTVDGKPHYLINEGEDGMWNAAESVEALRKLVVRNRDFWGALPYEKFVFLNILGEGKGGGGLEHRNSLCVLASRYAMRTRAAYVGWLSLMSHEYFHTWNVKRLRPVELGPFDYENENYTRGLWVAEGITSYYDDLMLARTGLITQQEYLTGTGPEDRARGLSGQIEILQTTAGRLNQSAAMASYDAWIKFYRPDENTPNTVVSYYTKGAVVAFLLDARIRAATGGARSLDDGLRLAFTRYSGERGFTEEEFRATLCEVANTDLLPWLRHALDTTEELDYTQALEYFGLGFQQPAANASKASLGLKTKVENGRLSVAQTPSTGPFSAGDELLGIGEYRVHPEQWTQRMEQYRVGDPVSVLIARRDKFLRVETTLQPDTPRRWTLEVQGEPNAAFTAWLEPPQSR